MIINKNDIIGLFVVVVVGGEVLLLALVVVVVAVPLYIYIYVKVFGYYQCARHRMNVFKLMKHHFILN